MNKQVPLVSIICNTYNHEPYIRQCLEGFVMQKTDFVFEVLIHDDASTDKTSDIIREYEIKYPKIIKPIYQTENQYSKGIKIQNVYQFPRVKGKYIALCEGDDYWIDPLKLQKQFNYMESHPNCSLLHTAFKFYTQHDETFHDSTVDEEFYDLCQKEHRNVACEIIDFNYRVVTASSFFKYELFCKLNNDEYYNRHVFMLGDIQLWTMLLQYGEIGYLSDVTAVYRVHAGSACRQVNMKLDARMSLSISEMQLHFLPKVKGGEYLRSKFCKRFKKNLFKYRMFEPTYSSFITDNDCNINKFVVLLLNFKVIRLFAIELLKFKRKLYKNSLVKIKSIKK